MLINTEGLPGPGDREKVRKTRYAKAEIDAA
jgi:hypothetical protein